MITEFTQEEMMKMRSALKASFEDAFGQDAFERCYLGNLHNNPSIADSDFNRKAHAPLALYFMHYALTARDLLNDEETQTKLVHTFKRMAVAPVEYQGNTLIPSCAPEQMLRDVRAVVEEFLIAPYAA